MGTDQRWPVGASETFRPYAFLRSAGTGAAFTGVGTYISPRILPAGETAPAASTCGGGTFCGRSSHGTYSPGGVY
jgi:hypothetical protein